MQIDIPIVIGVMGALASALYFFIRRDLKGNGMGKMMAQIRELHAMHKGTDDKVMNEHQMLMDLKKTSERMHNENVRAHVEIASVLNVLVDLMRRNGK